MNSRSEPWLGRVRQWSRSDMRVLRWVFLALYVLLVTGLLLPLVLEGVEGVLWALGILAVGLGAQALFIFGAGTIELCRPVQKRRLVLPVLVAGAMMALLVAGVVVALSELLHMEDGPWWGVVLVIFVVATWIIWTVAFLRQARQERRTIMRRIMSTLFAGSLLELMVTVPSHVIVSRRPGCLVGLSTMLGIIAGVCVMVWSFGPAIVLLFLRPRYRRDKAEWATRCQSCGYDLRGSIPAGSAVCPECGTPIRLRPTH